MACDAATAAGNHALSRSSARAASQLAAVVSSAFTNMLAAWCLTAWKVPMVRPNCARTLAYSTAMSRAAQLTPTASADARIRNTVSALRAAPRSTRSPSTVAQRDRPDAAGGVQGVQCRDRHTVGPRVDDDDVLARGDHQHIGVRRPQYGGAFAGDDQVRTDRDLDRQGERTDRAPVG